jgi:hypothetical protein
MARHEAIEVAGATLRHLPLNPNRPVLLKLKALLRKVVERINRGAAGSCRRTPRCLQS